MGYLGNNPTVGTIATATSVSDQANTSTGAFDLPAGNTSQRPSSPSTGNIRHNSQTGYPEYYNGTAWVAIATPPSIASVSPTTFSGEQGTEFTIAGSFFDSQASIKFITSSSVEYTAATVTYVNSTTLHATTPQDFTIADGPLKVKVINASGLTYEVDSAISCGASPTWTTAAGTIATVYDNLNGTAATLAATDPDTGATISYGISSGALPGGLSLNATTGVISGNIDDVVSQTTSNFTAAAIDNAGNQVTRAFSIVVSPTPDGSTSGKAAPSAAVIKSVTGITTDGVYWIQHTSGYTTAYQVYCNMSDFDGGWTLAFSVTNQSSVYADWFNGDTSMSGATGTDWFAANSANNLNLSTGANTTLTKANFRGPAFTSLAGQDLLIIENYNGTVNKKAYRLNSTQNLLAWFARTNNNAFSSDAASILGSSVTTSGNLNNNGLMFNYDLTNDGGRLVTVQASSEASGGMCTRVDGYRNYTWRGNLTRDDSNRSYGSVGTTADHTWWVFVR